MHMIGAEPFSRSCCIICKRFKVNGSVESVSSEWAKIKVVIKIDSYGIRLVYRDRLQYLLKLFLQ